MLTLEKDKEERRCTMDFDFDEALPVLKRTPGVLRVLLLDLPEPWMTSDEDPGTWTPFDVLQVVRVMARQYTTAVGPWEAYFSIIESG